MTATIEQAKGYKTEALNLYNSAQSKMDEYEGKDMPKDVFEQVEALFAQGDQKSRQAELTQKAAEAQVWKELPNDLKRLETPTGKLKPEAGNEDNFEKVMEKYGLKRWQIKDMKLSIGAFDRAYRHAFELAKQSTDPEIKALTESAATSGATLTPDVFVPEFVNKLYLASHLRQAGSRIVPLRSDITRYPKMTTASAAASLIAEIAAVTATNATYGEQAFTAYMFRALQQASLEIVADAEFDLLSEIILPDLAQQFAAAENSYFTLGTGSSQPQGLVNALSITAVSVAWATSAAINFDDVINLMHKPAPQYRLNPTCGFMCNDSVIQGLRKIKAVSGGTYIWEPSQKVGQPDTIYGKPVYYNQSMTTAVTAGTFPLLFGDFNYFWIGDRLGLEVRTAQELYLANAQVGYFAFKRVDSHVMQTEAFGMLVGT